MFLVSMKPERLFTAVACVCYRYSQLEVVGFPLNISTLSCFNCVNFNKALHLRTSLGRLNQGE
jgi:hypothetical protein